MHVPSRLVQMLNCSKSVYTYAQMTHRDGSFEDVLSECLPEQCLLLETLSRKASRQGVTGTDACNEHCMIFMCVAKDTLKNV